MTKSTKIKAAICAVIAVVVIINIIAFVEGFREPVVLLDGNLLTIQAAHGVVLDRREIAQISLLDEMPTLTRGRGFGFGNFQRGEARISGLGEGRVYVRVGNNRSPYIFIDMLNDTNYIFINLNNSGDTRELYRNLQVWLDS